MVPRTNMPDYKWLRDYPLDPQMVQRKMEVLDFPYTAKEIKALEGKNEMDAIVAYMQKLGSDIPWREATETTIVGELVNPYTEADQATISSWAPLYADNCAACHGARMEGDIGPELIGEDYDDEILFEIIYSGITDGGMPGFSSLGTDKVWKLTNFIRNYKVEEDQ
jgi:cytochrome c oxidase cbb3-type subunit 2